MSGELDQGSIDALCDRFRAHDVSHFYEAPAASCKVPGCGGGGTRVFALRSEDGRMTITTACDAHSTLVRVALTQMATEAISLLRMKVDGRVSP